MAHSFRHHDNIDSYMDDVRVKISEKYKPPPKINLAVSHAQRLAINRQIEESIPKYDGVLERTVIQKMREWKSARSAMFEQLQHSVDQARQDFKPSDLVTKTHSDVVTTTTNSRTGYNNPLVPTQAKILTPISQSFNNTLPVSDKSPFNISDFEADTSSPFDNMELQSINDMEELAQVLKSDPQVTKIPYGASNSYPSVGSYYPVPSYVPPVYTNGLDDSQYNPHSFNRSSAGQTVVNKTRITNPHSVPDIIRSLKVELDNNTQLVDSNNKLESRYKNNGSSSRGNSKSRSDDRLFQSLPKMLQDMSLSISSMGFPLDRVARVSRLLGNDEKKVVDHLLAMSELLDLGFAESSISEALMRCDNDKDKALDVLIS